LELTCASNWLTVFPVQEHRLALPKTAFHDAITLVWLGSCYIDFLINALVESIEHVFSYPKGAFPIIRQN